jgi:hypothetical protein
VTIAADSLPPLAHQRPPAVSDRRGGGGATRQDGGDRPARGQRGHQRRDNAPRRPGASGCPGPHRRRPLESKTEEKDARAG